MGPAVTTVYSQRLGAISDAQLAAVASRLGLGAFVSAAPTVGGLFGQNLFLTTDAGEFVLRGAPHWMGGLDDPDYRRLGFRFQFTKEAFFVDQLHEHTRAPAPWPYLRDESADIFGWPYVVMPRMPGSTFNERTILKALEPRDRRDVAQAAGAMLAEMQRLTSPFAGDFDDQTIALTPDRAGDRQSMIAAMRVTALDAQADGLMTSDDMDWIDAVAHDARRLSDRPTTFTHGDYKLENMTFTRDADGWRIGGIFDLQTARFGDGAYDLVHQACAYFDTEPALAAVFVRAYRTKVGDDVDLTPWAPLYVLRNRIGIWRFFVRVNPRPAWSRDKTFRSWAEPYLVRMLRLLER